MDEESKDSLRSDSIFSNWIRTESIALLVLIPPSSFFPSLLLTALVEPSAHGRASLSSRGGGVVPAERARLEPQTRDLSGVSRTPWVFSLFMWRNRIKSVAASRVGGWDYSRTVTGQVTPGIPCNRFFLADLSFLSLPLSPRILQFSSSATTRGNI